jgi:hypothetical protein
MYELNGAAYWHPMNEDIDDLERRFKDSQEHDTSDWRQALESELYKRLDGRELYGGPDGNLSSSSAVQIKFYKALGSKVRLVGHPRNTAHSWEWLILTAPFDGDEDSGKRVPVTGHEVRLTEGGIGVYRFPEGQGMPLSPRPEFFKTGTPVDDGYGRELLKTIQDMVPDHDLPELTSGPIPLPPAPPRDAGSGAIQLPPAPLDHGS